MKHSKVVSPVSRSLHAASMYKICLCALFLFLSPLPVLAARQDVLIWWYVTADDQGSRSAFQSLLQHAQNLTRVAIGCGHTVSIQGELVSVHNVSTCSWYLHRARAASLLPSLIIGTASNSIDQGMRQCMASPLNFSSSVVHLTREFGDDLGGWQFDWEPQGTVHPTPTDNSNFVTFLRDFRTAVRKVSPKIFVSVDVAAWTPFLSQYGAIASSVDLLLNMETYGAPTSAVWLGYFHEYVKSGACPVDKAGVGLGDWMTPDKSVTASEMELRRLLGIVAATGVSTIAIFRYDPPSLPNEQWWWSIMGDWKAGRFSQL